MDTGWAPASPRPSPIPRPPEDEARIRSLVTNVVEIATGRIVGYHFYGGIDARCPTCASRYDDETWTDAVDAWAIRVEPARAVCASCHTGTPAELIAFLPAWGLGHLSVTFWNWPRLHDDFIAELRGILGRRAVYQWDKP